MHIYIIFKSSFRFTEKLRGRYWYFPYKPSFPTHVEPPSLSTSPTRVIYFLQLTNLHTHHNHSKSLVYIRVHSWCCTFYGFEQVYNDMYPSLQYPRKYFLCLNIFCKLSTYLKCFIDIFLNFFIFGCVGSSLLCACFL